MKINKYDVLGLNYCATDYHEASDLIIEKAKEKKSFTIGALAVHGISEAYRNKKFRIAANNIDMLLPDGHPIKWAMNNIYKLNLKDRVCGPDLIPYVLEKANKYNLKLFLYGSREQTLKKFALFVEENYPGLEVCGIQPFRDRDATEEDDKWDIDTINNSGAHLVFVGLGCPRQEFWIESHKNKIHATLFSVGAALDFHAKIVKRAPKWMQDNSLEWLYRLLKNPKRLGKRYLISNSLFIYLFLKHKLKKMTSKLLSIGVKYSKILSILILLKVSLNILF